MTTKKKQTDETAVEEKAVETKTATVEDAKVGETADEQNSATAEEARSGDNGAQPATEFEASGAPVQIVADVDPSHPAVDNDPRASTTAEQNRIDFNDPTISGEEAVKRNLEAQSKG